MTPASAEFSISRVFDAPRETVFAAFTEAERLVHWWGPKGFKMVAAKLDLRPGGVFQYGLRPANGSEMWARFVYREITPPERIVFVSSFTDEQGNVMRCPMSATWPLEVLNTLTLTESGGKTTLSLTGVPLHATDDERVTFERSRDSMRQGFTGTFDQLAEYLAKS